MKRFAFVCLMLTGVAAGPALAAPITDPNDPRNWQGATVGTFAQLIYGSNTLATRQQIVDNLLLDDGLFDPAGYLAGSLIRYNGASPSTVAGVGYSTDTTGTGSLAYGIVNAPVSTGANGIDNLWIQTNNVIGHTVWDLGFQATKAAVFNTIDHGPLPGEAIESTVYLSNDMLTWTQAVTERVWLEGFMTNTGIKWDGFTYAVGTGTPDTFRYASVIWGGPGALLSDGDNEINGVMGLQGNFQPTNPVPEPASMLLLGTGLAALILRAKRAARRQ